MVLGKPLPSAHSRAFLWPLGVTAPTGVALRTVCLGSRSSGVSPPAGPGLPPPCLLQSPAGRHKQNQPDPRLGPVVSRGGGTPDPAPACHSRSHGQPALSPTPGWPDVRPGSCVREGPLQYFELTGFETNVYVLLPRKMLTLEGNSASQLQCHSAST